MRHLFNIRIHPAVIVSSLIFWFALYLIIYALIMVYYINKMMTGDNTVRVDEVTVTGGVVILNRRVIKPRFSKYIGDSLQISKR